MSDERTACAHRRVVYVEVHYGDGTASNRWECDLCRTEFFPIPEQCRLHIRAVLDAHWRAEAQPGEEGP